MNRESENMQFDVGRLSTHAWCVNYFDSQNTNAFLKGRWRKCLPNTKNIASRERAEKIWGSDIF